MGFPSYLLVTTEDTLMPNAIDDVPRQAVKFASFDGSTTIQTKHCIPDRYRFWKQGPPFQPCISRGAGLSYAAASFSSSGETIDHSSFNRILDFDSSQGILEVEGGTTLGQIYKFATRHGMMLAVQPGHPKITVGGCLAPDVHGKNQFRDGTFLSQVESVLLFHQSYGLIELSRNTNPELFSLTCGGYGLTGCIISARLRLVKIPSPRIRFGLRTISNIFDLRGKLVEAATHNELIYSWHNFLASGDRFGKGFLVTGNFLDTDSSSSVSVDEHEAGNLSADSRARLPLALFNRFTTKLFNGAFERSMNMKPKEEVTSLYDFLFPIHDKEIYFYLFGRRGFHECQIIVQTQHFDEFAHRIREWLSRHPIPITLASAKLFGGARDLLRFSGAGVCLSLNFPRTKQSLTFCLFLDELTKNLGGWPNIIKDSRLSAKTVASAYPGYEVFRDRLRKFDPRRLYRSELSERLAL